MGGGNALPNTVTLSGMIASNVMTVSQYSAPCYPFVLGINNIGYEFGNGTLSKQ